MAERFRTAVDSIMFCTSMELVIILVIALKAIDTGFAHYRCKVRVLSVSLLAAAPSWITENVDIRCPEGKTIVLLVFASADCVIVLGSCLV